MWGTGGNDEVVAEGLDGGCVKIVVGEFGKDVPGGLEEGAGVSVERTALRDGGVGGFVVIVEHDDAAA